MLFPIPIGYFVSTFLLISGTLNCLEYLANKPENCTRAVLLNGLAEAGWPIIAGSVILLLIQLNKQMEQLRLHASVDLPPSSRKTSKKSATDSKETPVSHKQEPARTAPPVNLAHLAKPNPDVEPPVQPASPSGTPMHPAPPVQRHQPPMPPRAEPAPSQQGSKQAPGKSESLNFFKVD